MNRNYKEATGYIIVTAGRKESISKLTLFTLRLEVFSSNWKLTAAKSFYIVTEREKTEDLKENNLPKEIPRMAGYFWHYN